MDMKDLSAKGQNLTDMVNIVDVSGTIISTATKLDAHSDGGKLHLAFSVMLFFATGEVLLQKRSSGKYHFPGKWANACCSHPRPTEDLLTAAKRRVNEELAVEADLEVAGNFIYRAQCDKSFLTEYEFDYVLVGHIDESSLSRLSPDKSEVEDMALIAPEDFMETEVPKIGESLILHKNYDIKREDLAPWFLPALSIAKEYIDKKA